MREAIHSSAMSAFDRIERPSHDWLNANLPIVEPLIEAKRQVLLNYKRNLWQRSSISSRSATQSAARHCATTIGLNFATKYSYLADLGNIMYNGIKRDLGPSEKKTVPLKTKYREPITDLKEQMDRLVKHYSELYLRETDLTAATLNS